MSARVFLFLGLLASLGLLACGEEPAAPAPATPDEDAPPAEEAPREEEGVPLQVPPEQIHRARREAEGLARMPARLRSQTLDERGADTLGYAELVEDPDAHAHRAVRFTGQVGLARSAGDALWILALMTRRSEERWVDPLYVLSVVDPRLPPDGGETATVHGWVVGRRTIGRHALPLVVVYAVERE